ncbi:alginate lyase family protein [Paenibacillus anaericanus]|uniref:Alginate lyase family protein n=1 Tax=Paenibacillus anaericanus TaxID=170367 RepID=A0A433Y5V4_9BACL|nr:alginate lyase family protein [Paenibacillus anaericanus]RUT43956.1 alginate lyase family protein [Paenibacillus anaericanus]
MNVNNPIGYENSLFSLLNLDHPGLERVKKAVLDERYDEGLMAFKQYLLSRTYPKMFLCKEDLAEVCEYVSLHCPEELREVMKAADEVVAQTFLFRFPWDMERTCVPVTFDGPIDWNHIPDGDVEWAYMLNRHRYWLALGQAYQMTGDEKYANTFCLQLEDWIERNPVPSEQTMGTLTWRSIEAGLRCGNWIKTLPFVMNSPHMTSHLLTKVFISMHEHAEYLASSFTGWKHISNWGVLETCGLIEMSVFVPEFKRSFHWQQLSIERMGETARLQVMKDGIHWEQSPTYHHEVLNCYLDMLTLTINNKIEIEYSITETIRKMAIASLYWAKPNHRQIMLGDSDNNDIRSVLTASAIVLQDATLRFGGYDRIDFDNVWNFGSNGIRYYDECPVLVPPRLSHAFEHSGHYVMRSGWDEQALYLYFRCGPLGGGHGHADMLHIDIHAYGKELLTDLGRYNYSDHTPLRRQLKLCSSHNTTVVDDIEFTEVIDTWQFGRVASKTCSEWITETGYDYVSGSHNGYKHLDDPVYPSRQIIFIKPYYWLLVDYFDSQHEHTCKQYFHFAPGEISTSQETGICRTENKHEANLCIIPVHASELKVELSEGVISYEYNLVEPNYHVSYERTHSGAFSMMQVLYPLRAGETTLPIVKKITVFLYTGELADDSSVEACKIMLPQSDEEHIIVVCHRPPARAIDSYVVDGIQIFGEVVLIVTKGEGKEITVIK